MISFVSEQGHDPEPLYTLVGANSAALQVPDCKVETQPFIDMMERALVVTGDPCLGLHAGEYMNLSAAGLVLQIMQTSRTLREALVYVCEFANLGCALLPMHMQEEGDVFRLRITPDPLWLQRSPETVRQMIDGIFTFNLREIRTLVRQAYQPQAIHFAFSTPDAVREYERVLQAPLRFDQTWSEIVYPVVMLDQPVVTSDFAVLQILVQHAEEKLARIQQSEGFFQTVKRAILNLVKPQFPSIEEVAANLNLSVRTLQRKLREEGKTFKGLLEELKYEFALTYLKRPDLSVAEIADTLNYAEPSGFIRSFKRWTGQTPQRFREGP